MKEHEIVMETDAGPFCANCGENAALGGPCPIRVLSLGAGVQSTTLLMMMVKGEIQKADHAIFSDTGWEPKAVYAHLDSLVPIMEQAGIQFHRVSKGDIQREGLADLPWFVRNPDGSKGMTRRQCTSKYKLDPLRKKQRELAGLEPGQRSKHHLVTTIIGISWDESHRMKDPFYSWIQNEYPLVDSASLVRTALTGWRPTVSPGPRARLASGARFTATTSGATSATTSQTSLRKRLRLRSKFRLTLPAFTSRESLSSIERW